MSDNVKIEVKGLNISKEELERLKKEHEINQKKAFCAEYIYSKYPQVKQNSDLADKLYYETLIKTSGVKDLEADIVKRVENFYEGKSVKDVILDVDSKHKEAYIQLVKVGIRVAWVQRCKAELKAAIIENREPNFPKYPL